MAAKRKIEVLTAGCALCEETVAVVSRWAYSRNIFDVATLAVAQDPSPKG
jgi:hypothetical protein